MKYFPFLKLKQNEISALNELEETVLDEVTPFFDIAKPQKNISAESVAKSISSGKKNLLKNWDKEKPFYIDSFDIPDNIKIDNTHVYKHVLDELCEFNIIPVVGLNRSDEHLHHTLSFLTENESLRVAIRLTPDDFSDFDFIKDEFDELIDLLDEPENVSIDLVLDCRLILDEASANALTQSIIEFLSEIEDQYTFSNIIFTGSSISANIADHIETDEYMAIARYEWDIFTEIASTFTVSYGDYAIISPHYSDANIDPKLLRNVSTPKLFYTDENLTHIFRGGSFKHSAEGQNQYFDLAEDLVSKNFYREKDYSFGDNFIYEKSQRIGSPSSQGNWYKVLNNCHITYVCVDLL